MLLQLSNRSSTLQGINVCHRPSNVSSKLTTCPAQMRPQMLVFMLPEKAAFQYLRIKKSADCRYGVVSQCVQNVHVQKCAPQYLSNVLMKFNAKLGGTTAKVASVSAQYYANMSSPG